MTDLGQEIRAKMFESKKTINYDGLSFKPKEAGTNGFSILPYKSEGKHPIDGRHNIWYRRVYFQHNNIGPDGDKQAFICPSSIFQPCPICEKLRELYEDFEENAEVIKKIKRKRRELYNIIEEKDLLLYLSGSIKLEEVIQLFDYSFFGFGEKLEEEVKQSDPKKEYSSFANCENGKLLKVRFIKSELKGTKPFYKASRIDFENRKSLDEKLILASSIKLDKILNIKSYEEIKKTFEEIEEVDD